MTSCTKECSTIGSCPFSYTDESEQAQNYGCLPTPYEIMLMRVVHGKTWACHSNSTQPCLGAINNLKNKGHEYKVIDTRLITLNDNWSNIVGNHLSFKEQDEIIHQYNKL